MKALRYLLSLIAVVSVLSISAQTLAQRPEAKMQSTSVMMSSGSMLPQAAVEGTMLTGTTIGSYSPANTYGGPRKVEVNPGGGGDPDEPGDNSEPWEDPLGDAMIPLMLLACAYLIVRVVRRRTREGIMINE